jgi:Na+/proline symporter
MIEPYTTALDQRTGFLLLGIFGLLWVLLGIWWGRKARNLEGFMLAGRNVGLALGAATAMATWVTSNTIMLAPKFALQMGIWGMLAYSTAAFGLLLFAPLALRIRDLMPGAFTSGDFVRLRYGRACWYLFLLISFVYSMAWLVTMGMAGGKFLQALSGLDYVYGMTIILVVCVLYTLFGGLYAVIGTDFIQSLIILVGVVIVGTVVLSRIDLDQFYRSLQTDQPALVQVFMPVALLSLFNNMFFGFGEVFHNNVWWSRAFAMRRGVAHRAFGLSALFWLPIPVAAGFIGLCAGPLGVIVPDPDMVGPLVASRVLGAAGSVVVFIVLFCSLASSIDSLLAATSDLLLEDVYRKIFRPSAGEETLRRASRGVVLGLGLITWLLCYGNFGDLLQVLFLSGPLVGSTVWPIVAGLYWRRTSGGVALAAMLLGSAVGLVAYFQIGWFVASLISTSVSMLTVMLGSLLFSSSRFQWAALDETGSTVPTR